MSQQTVIVYSGLPGVGKSTASAYTATNLPAKRYRSDAVRKRLFPDPTYSKAEVEAIYEELFARAQDELASGTNVVLDATFRSKHYRERAASAARAAGATAQFVHVTCSTDVVRERLEQRTESLSDADLDVYRELKAEFEPFDREHVVIDNSGSLEETYHQIDRTILSETPSQLV